MWLIVQIFMKICQVNLNILKLKILFYKECEEI